MLYKKVHRQYVKEWRIGRKFRFINRVCKITSKPYISYLDKSIRVTCDGGYESSSWPLINIGDVLGLCTRARLNEDNITWLN